MKKAIVVGATSGIGLEVARLLSERGYIVGVAGRRVDRLEAIVKSNENIKAYRQIDVREGVSKLSYSKKKSQSPDFHKPGLCYV